MLTVDRTNGGISILHVSQTSTRVEYIEVVHLERKFFREERDFLDMRYADLIQPMQNIQLKEKMHPLTNEQIQCIQQNYPGIPQDYLDFLIEIGYGNLNGTYRFFSGLVGPEEIYCPETTANLGNILLFGSDGQGYCAGFAPEQRWDLIEVDPLDNEVYSLERTFEEFVRRKLNRLLSNQ